MHSARVFLRGGVPDMSIFRSPHGEVPARRFAVRDLSERYGKPTFDILFRDEAQAVLRCSEKLWDCPAQAEAAADDMERRLHRPSHWAKL